MRSAEVSPDGYIVSLKRVLSMEDLVATEAPLVAIHETRFTDRQLIGFAFPHCIADVKGVSM